jgi:DNA-binding HxlR family transcriptional regulator
MGSSFPDRAGAAWERIAGMKKACGPRLGRPVRGSRTGRPMMALLDILGRRWTLRVLWELRDGPVKFRELAARCESMSQSVLSVRLKELEASFLVANDVRGWRLTADGASLLRLLAPLSKWSDRWAAKLLVASEVAPAETASRRGDSRK